LLLLLKGWCTQLANEKFPDADFDLDHWLIISDGDIKEVCHKAWLLSTAEEMKHSIAKWKCGPQELESVWGALVKAREALHLATSTRLIKERLQDWPWQCVDISELKIALKEDESDDDYIEEVEEDVELQVEGSRQTGEPLGELPIRQGGASTKLQPSKSTT
jgi:hypothetical protein